MLLREIGTLEFHFYIEIRIKIYDIADGNQKFNLEFGIELLFLG